jgi:putative inorganic carbon (HCO3(-)) transporter
MGLRDLLVMLLVLGSLPFILKRPYIGIIMWCWLSYMNPHRLAWGFSYFYPYAQTVAITLFIAMAASREKLSFPRNSTVLVWILFVLLIGLSTTTALSPGVAWVQFVKIIKIQLMTFLTIVLINDEKKLNHLIWIIVISLGYFSVKGGVFTLLTGGAYRVYGPPDSFITENNTMGLTSLMIIPLMLYLHRISRGKNWVQRGLAVAIFLSCISIAGSHSRGAFITVFAMSGFFWLKTKSKIISGAVFIILAAITFSVMPQSWHDRMATITDYENDPSAQGRLNAWSYSVNVANDRLFGAGLESYSFRNFRLYAPKPRDVHAAHSIYFGALADHGWMGLILFLLVLFLTWRSTKWIRRKTSLGEIPPDLGFLATMLQVSLVAYMSGGMFLSLTYFDLPWHLVAIVVILRCSVIVEQTEVATEISAGNTRPRHGA